MSRTLTISEALHARLEAEARLRGLSVEQLLEDCERKESEIKRREEAVRGIRDLHERIRAKYGEMPDSVELIREDRER